MTVDFIKQDEWQRAHDWPALRSALAFADGYIGCLHHKEAVSECAHCNLAYIVAWAKRQIESITPSGGQG